MEPLLKQLGELPKKFVALSRGLKLALVTVLLLSLGLVAAATVYSNTNEYQYAFSNLSADDSAEISAQLKAAGVPFRFEAGAQRSRCRRRASTTCGCSWRARACRATAARAWSCSTRGTSASRSSPRR